MDSGCPSRLRILLAASTHYSLLRQFLGLVYTAYKNHKMVHDIDVALCEGDFSKSLEVKNATLACSSKEMLIFHAEPIL